MVDKELRKTSKDNSKVKVLSDHIIHHSLNNMEEDPGGLHYSKEKPNRAKLAKCPLELRDKTRAFKVKDISCAASGTGGLESLQVTRKFQTHQDVLE